jgi:cystathionine beta-lyase/cystathionine gamma-synthase
MDNNNLTHLKSKNNLASKIFYIRNQQVMIDRNLAELYNVQTKRINEQVKRNKERFPEMFCFQLTSFEKDELVAFCDQFKNLKHSYSLPYAFTEQGVAMLSAVLKSAIAVEVSISIMNAFVTMRHQLNQQNGLAQRILNLENNQIETNTKFDQIFSLMHQNKLKSDQGIFFDGQVYDAYVFISDLIRSANKSIYIIDNYIDDTVLTILLKRKQNVKVEIFTNSISKQFALDLQKYNSQYENIQVKILKESHDRFLIIDNEDVYHIGASIKDLGKKWFAFSKMNKESLKILEKLK